MTTETLPEPPAALAMIVQRNAVELEVALPIIRAFAPFYLELLTLAEEAKKINVTDATQIMEIKQARAVRLKMRDARIGSTKVKDEQKEVFLRMGKAVQGIHNGNLAIAEPEEARLQEMENFAERAEAKRKADRAATRLAQLQALGEDAGYYNLFDMPEEQFDELVAKLEAAKRQREAEAAQREADRLELEEMERQEREAQRLENERLKKEADIERERVRLMEATAAAARAEHERAMQAEHRRCEEKVRVAREAADARLKKEQFERAATEQKLREEAEEKSRQERAAAEAIQRKQAVWLAVANAARAKAEAEAKALQDEKDRAAREAQQKLAEEERQKKAQDRLRALQPDKEKLLLYFQNLRAVPTPTVSAVEASDLMGKFEEDFDKLILWAMNRAKALN